MLSKNKIIKDLESQILILEEAEANTLSPKDAPSVIRSETARTTMVAVVQGIRDGYYDE